MRERNNGGRHTKKTRPCDSQKGPFLPCFQSDLSAHTEIVCLNFRLTSDTTSFLLSPQRNHAASTDAAQMQSSSRFWTVHPKLCQRWTPMPSSRRQLTSSGSPLDSTHNHGQCVRGCSRSSADAPVWSLCQHAICRAAERNVEVVCC